MTNLRHPKSKTFLLRAVRGAAGRFPVPLGYAGALAIFLIYIGAIDFDFGDHESYYAAAAYYLAAGTLLFLGLNLWSEEGQAEKRTVRGAYLTAHLLLLGHALYMAFASPVSPWEKSLSYIAIALFLCILALLIPFRKENNDLAAWNFGFRSIGSLALSLLVGHVMWGGLSLLLLSAEMLFGLSIDGRCYYYAYILCGELLSLALFFGILPQGSEKYDRTPVSSGFLRRVTRYLFLPLTAAYLLLLYAYAVRILLLWELPNGWCAWPVSILMGCCIGLEVMLYPARAQESRHFDEQVARWLPLLTVPLLILMTVGIGKRLADYGLTVPRLYLLTLNLWFYAVGIGLFLTRARRLRWVPASFALLFFLTSALPVNYTTLTHRHITRQVERVMEQTLPRGVQPPIDKTRYEAWLKSLPPTEARRMNDKLAYLHTSFGPEAVSPFLKGNVPYMLHNYNPDTAPSGSYIRDAALGEGAVIQLPAGYTRLTAINQQYEALPARQMDEPHLSVPLGTGENRRDTAYVRLHDFEQELEAGQLTNPVVCPCNSRDALFLLTRFYLNTRGKDQITVNISGYLLKQ